MQSPFTIFSFTLLTKKKEKPQFMASGLANNNNNNKTRTKEKQTNKQTNLPLYLYIKFLSLGWSELSDCNLNILDKTLSCLTPGLSKMTHSKLR